MRARFQYPVPPAPRTAVLVAGFRSKGKLRIFPDGWSEAAARFEPQAIAGRIEQIEALEGIAHPTHALIVIRRECDRAITALHRDRLWRAFGVPVFEQVVDERGTLLAAECEAHEGLHIESRRLAAGDHEIERAPCGCGKSSPRWIERVAKVTAAATASL